MKRLYLSFAILTLIACGNDLQNAEGDDPYNGTVRGNDPHKLRDGAVELEADGGQVALDDDGGTPAMPDSGTAGDAGTPRADASIPGPDASPPAPDASGPSLFEGTWKVTMNANSRTTCPNASQFSARIDDTWQFTGNVLMGAHLGPNPYYRETGADVWNTGEATIVATADLELVGTSLGGTFIFFRDTCNAVYDVTGVRP